MFTKLLLGLSFKSPKLNERTFSFVEKSAFVWQRNCMQNLNWKYFSIYCINSIWKFIRLTWNTLSVIFFFFFDFCNSIISDGFNLIHFLYVQGRCRKYTLFLSQYWHVLDMLQIVLIPVCIIDLWWDLKVVFSSRFCKIVCVYLSSIS